MAPEHIEFIPDISNRLRPVLASDKQATKSFLIESQMNFDSQHFLPIWNTHKSATHLRIVTQQA
ncbi:hypothetical protein YO5_16880 [Stutzerimonas stutzeri TS44]|nr:hypothetical protein YO5_16880 [Stutzerimonas stutzeri TS44]